MHIFKVVVFESLEAIYLTFFLPVKFARSNQQNSSDEIFINQRLVVASSMFALIVSLILRSAYHLRERGSELQMYAKLSGQWISVPAPSDPSASIPEWRQGCSYDQGIVVQMRSDASESDYDQVEYYMSVGANGNRCQPDDYVSSLLYQMFNEPRKTLVQL